jgi:hypothetical protein
MLMSLLLTLCGFASESAIADPGTAAKHWDRGQAVLYAEMMDASAEKSWNTIRLKPLATIGGRMDPAFSGEISAHAWIGSSMISSIHSLLAKGAKVVVVVIPPNPEKDKGLYFIPNGDADFFPTNAQGQQPCLFEVTGFDDPKVTETIENLRKLRGKQREEAEQKAAAEKKGK